MLNTTDLHGSQQNATGASGLATLCFAAPIFSILAEPRISALQGRLYRNALVCLYDFYQAASQAPQSGDVQVIFELHFQLHRYDIVMPHGLNGR